MGVENSLQQQISALLSNTDPAALDSLSELVVTENEGLTARLVTLEREVASLLAWARALTGSATSGA